MMIGEAYKKSIGGKGRNATDAAASRLLRKVKSRIDEIQQAAEKPNHLTIQEKRDFAANGIRTCVGQIDEMSPLCQEVHYIYDEMGALKGKKFKIVDKIRLIQLDNDLAGHVINRTEISGPNGQPLNIVQAIVINIPNQLAGPRVKRQDAIDV